MIAFAAKQKAKEWQKEKKEIVEKRMKFSDWMQLLQTVFNTYIRLRDADLPCISCGTTKKMQYHAGHYFGVGSFPNLRIDESNCHKQCSACNGPLNGNLHHYRTGIIERFGQEYLDELESKKNIELKISVPDIKLKLQYYRAEIKKIKNL